MERTRKITQFLSISLLSAVISLGLSGCNDNNEDKEAYYQLQLLHFADVDGGGTAAMFNIDEFSALVKHFRNEHPNTILASSGDNYIPGPIFQASNDDRLKALLGKPGDGRGETEIQNRLGLQVSAVGNHDLDTGPSGFAGIISPDEGYRGAQFPYISANIDFTADKATQPLLVAGGLEARDISNKVSASTVVSLAGERIGFVGAVTPTLPAITSVGNLTLSPPNFREDEAGLNALATAIQTEVDKLTAQGINKIIVLAHMQRISVEQGLATRLKDVDIIVAGGSNTLLVDENDTVRVGDSPKGNYPEIYRSPTDEPVLLVNVDADYKYLGRLVVDFDAEGRVLTDKLDYGKNGAWAATSSVVDRLSAKPIPEVVEVADVLRKVLGEQDGSAYGITKVFLDGRRASVRSRETNFGNLTSDANLWYGRVMAPENPPIISVKNGGGIRSHIGQIVSPAGSTSAEELLLLPPEANAFGKPQGGISQLDISTSLAFNNGLAIVTMTAAELKDLLEEIILGNFSHTAGLRVHFDPTKKARDSGDVNLGLNTNGERVQRVEVETSPGIWEIVIENGAVITPNRTFRVLALDFLNACAAPEGSTYARPNCGSNYPFNGLSNPEFVSLLDRVAADPGKANFASSGGEQDALAEYLLVFHPDEAKAYNVPIDVNERMIPKAN